MSGFRIKYKVLAISVCLVFEQKNFFLFPKCVKGCMDMQKRSFMEHK